MNIKRPLFALASVLAAAILLGTGCSSPLASPATATDVRSRAVTAPTKRVVGYFCEWGIYAAHDSYYVTSIPFDKLTHINYAFVGLDPATQAVQVFDPWATTDIVYPGEPWDTQYKGNLGQLRKAKLTHPNLKVLISVGGWTKSNGFHAAAANDTTRATAARNLVAFMKQYGLDGVDIDWEYPGVNRPKDPNDPYDMGAPGGPEDTVNFTLFLKAIRTELDRQGGLDAKHYELTIAAGIGYDKIAVTQPAQYAQYLDAINLMTYDMHGGFETVIGHQAPLYANTAHDKHEQLVNERYNIDWAVNEFLRLGVPASKIVVGVPFYSRGWDNVSGGWDVDGNGTPDGMFGTGTGGLAGKWGTGGQNPYFTAKQLANTAGWEKYTDPISKASWIYNRSLKQLLTYDDATAVTTKMDYVLAKGLGGAMYWELDGDDWKNGYDLVNIIAAKMLGPVPDPDTQAPTVPGNLSASGITSSGATLSWTASSDNKGVTAYVVSGAGAIQTVSGTSATLSGLSASTNYTVSVIAKDAAGNASPAATVSFKTSAAPTDTQAPTTPGNLSASGITSSGATLSWTASSDNVGVRAYVVSGAGATQTVTGTSATLSGLSASTSYTVRVIAKDAAGNASPAATVSFTTTSDNNTDPVLATGVPGTPNLQQDNWDGAPNFGINMNMWWGNNGTKFELFENGLLVATVTLKDNSPNAQTASVKFTGKAKGTYKYLGKLTNKFGTTSSGELSYTVR